MDTANETSNASTTQPESMPFTGFFAYKRNLYFPKEIVVLGGMFWGAILEVVIPLAEDNRILAELSDRLTKTKPIIDDPHWRFPGTIENSIYEAMGFKGWRGVHKKALSFGLEKVNGILILHVGYPGSGQKPGATFEIRCHDSLDEVLYHIKKQSALIFID